MFAFLATKLGMYLVGAAIVTALVGGGFLYVKHIRAQNADLKAQVAALKIEIVTLKRVAEIYEHDIEVDKEIASEKERVDRLTPEQLDAEFDRLRNYGKSNKNNNP